MAINLIVADPHPVFLLGLERLLTDEAEINLQAMCATAEETLQAVRQYRPDLLILDIGFRDRSGLDLIRDLRQENLPVKVIILAGALDDEQTIDNVHAGGQWMEKQSLGHAFEKMLRREAGARRLATILTDRETEVMCLVARGMSNRQIASQLTVGEGTVKVHVHNIYAKLGVNNRVDLTLYAHKKGLL